MIAAVDVAVNTFTGKEINESKLGAGPRATSADKLAGVAATGYLRSTRIESASVDFTKFPAPGILPLFTDTRVGVRVSYQNAGRLYLSNLSATADLRVTSLGYAVQTVNTTAVTVAPGSSTSISYDGVEMRYGSFFLTSIRNPAASSQVLQLTCSLEDGPTTPTFSCIGVG